MVDEEYNRYVTCFCGASVVVSRMPAWYDTFVVCSRGCFDRMVRANPKYWEIFDEGQAETQ